jgi:hypothetical protein
MPMLLLLHLVFITILVMGLLLLLTLLINVVFVNLLLLDPMLLKGLNVNLLFKKVIAKVLLSRYWQKKDEKCEPRRSKNKKHVELWAKNMSNEWQLFWSFDMWKLIVDLFKNEKSIIDLMEMIFLFVLQVAKKDNNLYPPRSYYFIFKFWNSCFALNYLCCLQNFGWIFFLAFFYYVYKQRKERCVVEYGKTLAVLFNIFLDPRFH